MGDDTKTGVEDEFVLLPLSKNPSSTLFEGELGKSSEMLLLSIDDRALDSVFGVPAIKGDEEVIGEEISSVLESKRDAMGALLLLLLLLFCPVRYPKYVFHASVSNEVGIPQNAEDKGSNGDCDCCCCCCCCCAGFAMIPGAANGSIAGVMSRREDRSGDDDCRPFRSLGGGDCDRRSRTEEIGI